MNRITLDDAVREKLGGLNDWLELVDETGRSLGQVVPARDIIEVRPEDQCPHTGAQLAIMAAQTGGRSLEEIWKDLGVE